MLPPLTRRPPASAAVPLRRGRTANPISSAIHRTVCASISVAAGDRRHAPTFWFTAEASRSPRAPIGAGLDVTDPEPLPPGHPLWSMENVIITPHIATSSDFRSDRTVTLVVENVRRYLRGDPVLSVVDLAAGY